MARTVSEIEQYIYDQVALKSTLELIATNPSQTALWKDFIHCIAVEMAVLEQLQDQYKLDVETLIKKAPVSTIDWVLQKCIEFQYDSVAPQSVQLIDGVAAYNPIDETKRIITVANARVTTSRILEIYVAKSSPPEPLTAPELSAIQAYFTDGGSNTVLGIGLGVAGIAYNLFSLDPDQVCIKGVIYADGQYAETVKADVIVAIESYLANLGKNGYFNTLQLKLAIHAVPGVLDMDLEDVAIRADATAFASRTFLVQAHDLLLRQSLSASGYAIGETTAANTLDDLITISVA